MPFNIEHLQTENIDDERVPEKPLRLHTLISPMGRKQPPLLRKPKERKPLNGSRASWKHKNKQTLDPITISRFFDFAKTRNREFAKAIL